MRECSTYRELLSARQDGMLSQAEDEELRAHLAECPSCRNYASLLLAVSDAAGSAPAELADTVLKKAAGMPPPAVLRRRRLLRVLVPVGTAAAVAVLVIGLWPALSGRFMKGAPSADSAMSEANVMTAGTPEYDAGIGLPEETEESAGESALYDAAAAEDDAAEINSTPMEPSGAERSYSQDMSDEAASAANGTTSDSSSLNIIFVEGDLPESLESAMTRNAEEETAFFDGDNTFYLLTPEEARALLEMGYPANFSTDLLTQAEQDSAATEVPAETFWMEWNP